MGIILIEEDQKFFDSPAQSWTSGSDDIIRCQLEIERGKENSRRGIEDGHFFNSLALAENSTNDSMSENEEHLV